MASTLTSNASNLSRLNRYFDSQPLPHPSHPSQTMRAHVTLARTPRHPSTTSTPNHTCTGYSNSGPGAPDAGGVQASPAGSTIDGAACKTSTWTYKHVSPKNGGVAVIEKGARVRTDKRARRPLQKLNWKEGRHWPKGFSPSKDYLDLDTRAPSVPSTASSDVSPRLAVKRVTLLASHQQYRDAASFIHRLPAVTVRSALADLPMDTLVEAMPLSLPVIEALYCTAGEVSPDVLHVDRVVWQMVRFFAQQEECLTGDIRWEFCGPFVNLCRDVLRVVARVQPMLRRTLLQRRKQLERAIEGMGHHGLVGTSDESLTSLHDALRLEFEKVVKSYTSALGTLQELGSGNKGHISKGPAPIQASHQRQLSITPHDIQERLIKNKSLLNIVEPTLGNHSLDILLGILQRRIEHDKDSLFQFTQLRKEAKDIEADAVVAPILMRYAHGCDQVLDMLREVMEEGGCLVLPDDDEGSDVSGYHSDSDSAIMMSGNSPYVTKHARFNFLTRSVRDRSRVGTRMSLPMTSSGLPSSGASSTSPPSSGPSCSSSAVGSDTQSQRGSDGGSGRDVSAKGGSPAPSSSQLAEDSSSVLKAPSEVASGVSTLPAGVDGVASRAELESLRSELTQARQTIRLMHEREKEYKERLNERSCRLGQEQPSCIRVTSPIRHYPNSNNCSSNNSGSNSCSNTCDNNTSTCNNNTSTCNKNSSSSITCNSSSHSSSSTNSHSVNSNNSSNNSNINCTITSSSSRNCKYLEKGHSSKAPERGCDRRGRGSERFGGRSKSVVNLLEESTGPHANTKHWAQTYSKEYPKGYLNKDSNSINNHNHTIHNQHQQQHNIHHHGSSATHTGKNSHIINNNQCVKDNHCSGSVPVPDYNNKKFGNTTSNTSSTNLHNINKNNNTSSCNLQHLQKQQNSVRTSQAGGERGGGSTGGGTIVPSLNGRLENVALGERRPSALVRRYGNLYAQARVETLDALDDLTDMRSASELKSKLVFSVVVLAFRSVSATATALRQDVRRILQVPPPSSEENSSTTSSSSTAYTQQHSGINGFFQNTKHSLQSSPSSAGNQASNSGQHFAVANSVKGLTQGSTPADVTALEAAMATVITTNVDNHDLTINVEDVCQQIWATLYDYPGLKECEGLLRYIKECVRVAWGLVNQSPPYCIEYEVRSYRSDLHVRFHTSDPAADTVRTYLWPALTEGVSGPCVHKGVVIT